MTNISDMMSLLQEGEVKVFFEKKDGSTRVMNCTLNYRKIPELKWPKGTGRPANANILAVFDLDKHDWRSFRLNSVRKYEPVK